MIRESHKFRRQTLETSLSIWSLSTGPPVAMASEVPASGSLVPSPVTHSLLVLWGPEGESYAWHASLKKIRVTMEQYQSHYQGDLQTPPGTQGKQVQPCMGEFREMNAAREEWYGQANGEIVELFERLDCSFCEVPFLVSGGFTWHLGLPTFRARPPKGIAGPPPTIPSAAGAARPEPRAGLRKAPGPPELPEPVRGPFQGLHRQGEFPVCLCQGLAPPAPVGLGPARIGTGNLLAAPEGLPAHRIGYHRGRPNRTFGLWGSIG